MMNIWTNVYLSCSLLNNIKLNVQIRVVAVTVLKFLIFNRNKLKTKQKILINNPSVDKKL